MKYDLVFQIRTSSDGVIVPSQIKAALRANLIELDLRSQSSLQQRLGRARGARHRRWDHASSPFDARHSQTSPIGVGLFPSHFPAVEGQHDSGSVAFPDRCRCHCSEM